MPLRYALLATLLLTSPLSAQSAPAPIRDPKSEIRNLSSSRAHALREQILTLLDQADQADGRWPDHIADPNLVYTKPLSLAEYGFTAVLHETFAQYPAGVWVAFADGHLEFATTADALASAKSQLPLIRPTLAKYGNVYGPSHVPNVNPADVPDKLKGNLTIKVLDPSGHPVPGALAGIYGQFGDEWPEDQRVIFYDQPKSHPIVSDANGLLAVSATRVYNPASKGSGFLNSGVAPLYVLDQTHSLVGLDEIALAEFQTDKVHEIKLSPVCHVKGKVSGMDLAKPLTSVECFAFKPGRNNLRAVFYVSDHSTAFDLPVRPGEYGIYISAHDCETVNRFIRIEPGQTEINLQIDLIPRTLPESLIGGPAPEFRNIKGWKNRDGQKPLTLADLHGKVVLLDFWGYWCGPCIGSMPELMRLHDKYKDKGLVIIGIHDDSVESIAEMEQKIETFPNKYWNNRNLPFAIALDGGGKVRIHGSTNYAPGTTTAGYHVNFFPTSILIDREGIVRADLKLYDPGARAEAEKRIAEELAKPE
jgi:thiol-disulfide isomerase/thioredoxin